MAYSSSYDVTTPSDLAPAEEGAERIRELKAQLSERLVTIFPGWPTQDPLELDIEAATPVTEGTLAARPNPPETGGLLYRATDTGQLFVSLAGEPPSWTELFVANTAAVATGELSARPNPPAQAGLLFRATDTDQLFLALPGDPSPTWTELFVGSPETEPPAGIGPLSARPNPPASAGLLYYATDEQKLYISQEIEDEEGEFEWITNATTNLKIVSSWEEVVQASGSPYTFPFSISVGITDPFIIGYRWRVSIPALPDTAGGSWTTVGEAQTQDGSFDTIGVSLTRLAMATSSVAGLLSVDVEPATATTILIEIEVFVAAQ